MKKMYVLLIVSILSTAIVAQSGKPSFIESFAVMGDCQLHLATSGGSLSVYPGSTNEITVEFYVHKGGKQVNMSLAELREHKEVIIDHNDNDVSIHVKNRKKMSWKNRYNVRMIAYVPKNTSATLATAGGSVNLEGVNGNQTVATSGGSITIAKVNGKIKGSTSGGSVSCSDVVGPVNLSTSGGSMKFNSIKGSIVAATSGGSVKLNNIQGSADVSTSGGSITGDFPSVDGPISLRTAGGSIRLDVPDHLGMNVQAKGSSVSVETGAFDGQLKKHYAKGFVNGGGVDVYCATSGGSVKIY